MQKITRQALLDFLRGEALKRCRTQRELREMFPGDTRFLTRRRDTVPYIVHNPSWERILQWLDKLGFEVRFEIVRKAKPATRVPKSIDAAQFKRAIISARVQVPGP